MTYDRIEINPAIMFGKPVIKGTRITVEHILRKLAGGMTIGEILADHPHLTSDDVYAAAAFAADYMAQEEPGNYVARLAGLHRDVWEGVNTTTYLREERDAWDASPNG